MRAGLGLAALAAAAMPASAAARWSFVSTPTDQLAVPGLFAASEITPQGGIYTGYGELDFASGPALQPYDPPQRSLVDGGRYPIFASTQRRAGVDYTVTMLATPVDGVAMDVVRVQVRNMTAAPRRARWAVSVRRSGGAGLNALGAPAFRYLAPAGTENGFYAQPGGTAQRWSVSGDTIVRDGESFALLAPGPRAVATAARCPERTQVCVRVSYARMLAPGRTAGLVFELPAVPSRLAIPRVGWAAARSAVHRSFDAALGQGLALRLPEQAVTDAYDASLTQILTSRYRLPSGDWVQTVNDLQYHAFWLRDAAIMTNALDLDGLREPALENLAYFGSWQQPDGLFISRPGQYDGFGQALWALGRHAELTGDTAFATTELPAVGRAVAWLDELGDGLLPAGNPGDNEYVAGRLAGDDFWAVAGMDAAVELARVAGRGDLAAAWAGVAARLRATVAQATRTAAAANGGAVPPALDRPGGRDWGNWWVAYPDGPVAPTDPIVTATIRRAEAGFREGIATYAGMLHDYTGFRIFETELERGEQAAVVDGLYAELAHATGTLGGFETDIRPGGKRSSAANLTPHGTYSGELVTLIRNMLVRDDGQGGVVLLGAVPGSWLMPGKVTSIARAPTTHGLVSFTLRARHDGATLTWSAPAGTRLVWPVPSAVSGLRASSGRVVAGALALPQSSGRVAVTWRLRPGGPTLAGTIAKLERSYG